LKLKNQKDYSKYFARQQNKNQADSLGHNVFYHENHESEIPAAAITACFLGKQ